MLKVKIFQKHSVSLEDVGYTSTTQSNISGVLSDFGLSYLNDFSTSMGVTGDFDQGTIALWV